MFFLEPIQWFVLAKHHVENLVSDGYPIWLITSSPYYSCKIVGQIPSEMLFPESLGVRRSKKIPIGSACRQRQTCFALFYNLNFRNKQNGQTYYVPFFPTSKPGSSWFQKVRSPMFPAPYPCLSKESILIVIGTLICLWQSSQNVVQNVSLSHLHTFKSRQLDFSPSTYPYQTWQLKIHYLVRWFCQRTAPPWLVRFSSHVWWQQRASHPPSLPPLKATPQKHDLPLEGNTLHRWTPLLWIFSQRNNGEFSLKSGVEHEEWGFNLQLKWF